MSLEYGFGLLAALGLAAYLVYALVRAERF